MTGRFRLACVQTNTTNHMAANIAAATTLIREARDRGADLIALPEVVAMMEPDRRLVYGKAYAEADHSAVGAFRDLARETGAWILGGSVTVRTGPGKVSNRAATTRSTCSMSICRAANPTASPTPTNPGERRASPRRRGAGWA
jgi:predicted amidohydrolase